MAAGGVWPIGGNAVRHIVFLKDAGCAIAEAAPIVALNED